MMGPQISAEAVDADTVAVITAAPDPLLPRRIYLGGVTSAKQILEDPASHDVHPIGTGPYVFDEWQQGQFWTAKANPDWWGNTADDTYGEIYFDSLRVVWRPEPIVRSAMVEGGEAHIAMFLTKEECARFDSAGGTKCMVKGSDTFLQFRLDYHGADPLLEDVNFRKAIFTGIDWDGIRQNLMGLGEPLAGQMLPSVATGFHDGIQQYAYDPTGAKAIVDELKAGGAEIPSLHISTRLGSTPRNGEMVEAMGAMLGFVGIPNTVAVEAPGVLNPRATTKPNPDRAYAWLHVQANPPPRSARITPAAASSPCSAIPTSIRALPLPRRSPATIGTARCATWSRKVMTATSSRRLGCCSVLTACPITSSGSSASTTAWSRSTCGSSSRPSLRGAFSPRLGPHGRPMRAQGRFPAARSARILPALSRHVCGLSSWVW